jgi:hypothetical protein
MSLRLVLIVNSANPRDVGPRSIKSVRSRRESLARPFPLGRAWGFVLRKAWRAASSSGFLVGQQQKTHLSVGSINDPTAILHGRSHQPLKAFLGDSMPMQNAVREFC